MLAETNRPSPTIAQFRREGARGPWLNLLQAVLELAGPHAELLRHSERPWASVTFSGARHTLRLLFEGTEAVAAGEALIAALPDHEFVLRGQLVADATIAAVEHTLVEGPRLVVDAELLVLEDA